VSDQSIARIGRALAEALANFAYSRSPDDKKLVAQLHAELCAECRSEIAEQTPE
jgi:hypothetical protein